MGIKMRVKDLVPGYVWRLALKLPPTCYIQWELSRRAGCEAQTLGLDEPLTLSVKGPATVTVNYD
jgi:hypothetical protein